MPCSRRQGKIEGEEVGTHPFPKAHREDRSDSELLEQQKQNGEDRLPGLVPLVAPGLGWSPHRATLHRCYPQA